MPPPLDNPHTVDLVPVQGAALRDDRMDRLSGGEVEDQLVDVGLEASVQDLEKIVVCANRAQCGRDSTHHTWPIGVSTGINTTFHLSEVHLQLSCLN